MNKAGPLAAVLAAFSADVGTVSSIAAHTGLRRDVVRAAVDHLVRLGRIDAKQLTGTCSSGSCGNCAAPTCGTSHGGPVLVELSLPHTG